MDTVILPISPQGQITIPKKWRDDLLSKKKVQITKNPDNTYTLEPEPDYSEWLDSLQGSGKGLWGDNPDTYIENMRSEWEK
jgi:AbrB family looped-hinge helix DNA binding protein